MENDGHAPLLAESRRANLLGLAQNDCAFRDDDVLVIVRVQRIRDKYLDWA
jgi:hypothetical protein